MILRTPGATGHKTMGKLLMKLVTDCTHMHGTALCLQMHAGQACESPSLAQPCPSG